MTQHPDHKAMQARRAAEREERRKVELKANMARRKAQIRERAATDEDSAQTSDKE